MLDFINIPKFMILPLVFSRVSLLCGVVSRVKNILTRAYSKTHVSSKEK